MIIIVGAGGELLCIGLFLIFFCILTGSPFFHTLFDFFKVVEYYLPEFFLLSLLFILALWIITELNNSDLHIVGVIFTMIGIAIIYFFAVRTIINWKQKDFNKLNAKFGYSQNVMIKFNNYDTREPVKLYLTYKTSNNNEWKDRLLNPNKIIFFDRSSNTYYLSIPNNITQMKITYYTPKYKTKTFEYIKQEERLLEEEISKDMMFLYNKVYPLKDNDLFEGFAINFDNPKKFVCSLH